MRLRLADRKIEAVTSLKGLRRVSDITLQGASWVGVAPDGSLLLMRDMGTQEIYALNLKGPLSIWWTRWDSNARPPHCERGKIYDKARCGNHLAFRGGPPVG